MTAGTPATLSRLRQAVAKIEGQETDLGVARPPFAFGIRSIDDVLQGGLASASLHEIAPAALRDVGAAAGFAFALAARAARGGGDTLCIQTDFAALESGDIYGLGCDLFGLQTQAASDPQGLASARCAVGDGRGAQVPALWRRDRRTAARRRAGRSHRHAPPDARRARRRQRSGFCCAIGRRR